MKKLFAILLLTLPLVAMAQVKPGIPISEVVREAKRQVAAEKGKLPPVQKIKGQSQQTKQQDFTQQNYVTYNYDSQSEQSPKVRAPRTPRAPRVGRTAGSHKCTINPEFKEQLNFDKQFGLSISTNGLLWLATVPNIDIRLQYDKFSVIGSAAYSGWTMENQKFWWSTNFGAEVHYDIIPNVYVGAAYDWLSYNIKPGNIGNQGVAQSLGIVAGYKLPIGRKLALDFGLGLGYSLIDNEKYHSQGDALIRDSRRTFGNWGLTKAQVSLVWRIL